MAGQKKTSKKKPSTAQSYYRQTSSRIRGNEALDRLTEGEWNSPARGFSHSASGRTGYIPSVPNEDTTYSGSARKNNNRNPNNRIDLTEYLTEKGELRETNIAVPDALGTRYRQIGRPDLNPKNGRHGSVLLQSSGHNQPRIPRNTRARGGPGLMGIAGPALAAGLGSLTRMIRDNNTKEMGKRR
jgi:hypothetical protein